MNNIKNKTMKTGWYNCIKDGKTYKCYFHTTHWYFTIETDNPEDKGRYAIKYFDSFEFLG